MPRRRLGVAVVLGGAVGREVDGLRRALGDGSLGSIAPHVTLVSPVNVRAIDIPGALALLRAAAGAVRGPIRLTLGPPTTFLPDNPVLYLPVGGDLPDLGRIHDALAAEPLARPAGWPWVPHVTLADGADGRRLDAAVAALDRYGAVVEAARITLLEQVHLDGAVPARRWVPLADADLGPPSVVGRGGLELRVTAGTVVGPDLAAVAGACAAAPPPAPAVVLTAEREGRCAGGAAAWWAGDVAHAGVLVAPDDRSTGVGRVLLAQLESHLRHLGWEAPRLAGVGPARFYAACSRWVAG